MIKFSLMQYDTCKSVLYTLQSCKVFSWHSPKKTVDISTVDSFLLLAHLSYPGMGCKQPSLLLLELLVSFVQTLQSPDTVCQNACCLWVMESVAQLFVSSMTVERESSHGWLIKGSGLFRWHGTPESHYHPNLSSSPAVSPTSQWWHLKGHSGNIAWDKFTLNM